MAQSRGDTGPPPVAQATILFKYVPSPCWNPSRACRVVRRVTHRGHHRAVRCAIIRIMVPLCVDPHLTLVCCCPVVETSTAQSASYSALPKR